MKFSKRSALSLLAVGVFALGACSSETSSTDATTQEQPADTQANEVVGAEEFASVSEQSDTVTLDVRTPQEFDAGHIEGAVNIDVDGASFTEEIARLDPGTTYAVYCRSGNRSATAVEYMSQQEFTSLYDLGGGIGSWQGAGYPLV